MRPARARMHNSQFTLAKLLIVVAINTVKYKDFLHRECEIVYTFPAIIQARYAPKNKKAGKRTTPKKR